MDATNQLPLEGATVTVGGTGDDLTLADGTYEISGIQVGIFNSPISVLVVASKEGYFTQSKTITVFCGASISINFGPPPPLGALEGFVTNAVTGDPIPNVLIVGEFGEETRTDADGHYLFEEVPVNDDGSPKTWNVTALPSGFTLQTKPVTIRANATARLDFQFGDAPQLGSFSLTKRADGPPAQWAFDVTGGPFDSCLGQEDFVLAKDETVTCNAELGRVVTITEPDPGDRYVLSIDCQDAPNADIDLANRRVSITLVEQPTQCTFTNTFQVGSFSLTKQADGPPAQWAFDVTGGPFDSCVGQEDFVLAKDETVTCHAKPGRVVTITEPSPGDDYLLTAIDCRDAPNVAIDLAARSVAITLLAGQVTSCDFINTFQEPADAAVFLIIDEDSLDNGLQFNASGGPIVPAGPDRFSARDVNDDRAGPRQRDVLTYFAAKVGRSITVKTGQTGDEGWFASNCIPQKWISGTSNACLDAGAARDTAVGRYIGIPDATAVPVQSRLDKIPAVMPLRARGLASLVGQTVCAVVYDSDISINYDRSTFPYTSANLQGATLGIVAFEVTAVRRLTGFSSSTLPEVQLTIAETSACGSLVLFNAPVPKSSSVPNDIDPGKISFDYRNPPSFRTRLNEELFY